MTFEQIGLLLLLIALLAVFALDRWRIEIVALCGLAVAVAAGFVAPGEVFSGFSNPAVVTVIEILLIVRALARTRLLDSAARWIDARMPGDTGLLAALCGLGAGLSVFMNNIGAFALMLPVALEVAQARGRDPRLLLMPLSFATLLGGLCSAIGTPANLVVSAALASERGRGFGFFDFAPVGLCVALAGLAVILWRRPRVPDTEQGGGTEATPRQVVSELRFAPTEAGPATVAQAGAALSGQVHAVLRADRRLFPLRGDTPLLAGDLLLADAALERLEQGLAAGWLRLPGPGAPAGAPGPDGWAEAVVMPQSLLVGARIATLESFAERDIAIEALAVETPRIEGRLADIRLGIGDVLFLRGRPGAIRDALEEAGALQVSPLPRAQPRSHARLPVPVFAAGIVVSALGLLPVPVALGAVVLVLCLARALDLRAALAEINWPILILLAAMIPLGEAVAANGAARELAGMIGTALPGAGALPLTAALLGLAILVTPFVNNSATAVVFAPIALELSRIAHVPPEPLLIAVSLGASLDFVTPFGHHNNTLAFGIAHYRFADFARAGWPVTLVGFVVALAAIRIFWI
ncbi:SLC13 family permease [Paroceanicella profunda]|uniref:SLC13 family permease n=1 Tax=Paroceanicella profunda TaxID=2579971 RepID=UPI001479116E|nr:SLC13 family permease [Paroceanicella profunda]